MVKQVGVFFYGVLGPLWFIGGLHWQIKAWGHIPIVCCNLGAFQMFIKCHTSHLFSHVERTQQIQENQKSFQKHIILAHSNLLEIQIVQIFGKYRTSHFRILISVLFLVGPKQSSISIALK